MSTSPTGNTPALSEARVWLPPPTVTDHLGGKLAPDWSFFAPPPPEIGEIRSAYTSLAKGTKLNTRSSRVRKAAIFFVAGISVAIVLEGAFRLLTSLARETSIPRPFWAALCGVLFALFIWWATRSKHVCNYVGSQGGGEFACTGALENLTRRKILRFKEAAAVSTSVTRHFRNRQYTYTDFSFRWFLPESEKACFEITGSHAANLETPPAGNYHNFGRAAESAWYDYLLPGIEEELARNGDIRLNMGNKRRSRLGRGFLEIEANDGAVHRCEAADIGSAKLQSGLLFLTRKDAEPRFFGPLGSSGSLSFDLNSIQNSRLFLYAFEKLLNIKLA